MTLIFPYYYVPLLVMTTFWVVCSLLVRTNFFLGGPVHGIETRCNTTLRCTLDQRTNFDTSWLCCEDATFWPSSHIIAPMGVMLIVGDPGVASFLVFVWEALEAASLTYINSFVIYPTTLDQLETTSGSLIGDALINGMFGILLGALIASYSGFPGVWHLIVENRDDGIQHWTGHRMRSVGVVWKYFGIFLLHGVIFQYAGRTTSTGALYGGYLSLASLFILLFVLFRSWIRADDAIGVDLRASFRRAAPLWMLCALLVGFGSLDIHFLANNYFQTWLMYYLATLLVIWWARHFPSSPPQMPSFDRQRK